MPNAAPGLYTSCRVTQSPMTRTGTRESVATASSLVTKSSTTTPEATVQNNFRLPALSIFLLGLALDAETGVGQRVQPLEPDVVAALVALAEFLRRFVQPSQSFVHVPEVSALLGREEKLLLPLHGVGALVRHVEGVGRQVAVGALQRRAERLVIVAQLLQHSSALL